MSRHAYLIIAHNRFDQLRALLRCLDDSRNVIFLHLDAKLGVVDRTQFDRQLQFAELRVLSNRVDVQWGDFSQIECELRLLEAATAEHCDYYHLMSGVDLPLQSQDAIHEYFDRNQGTEYVHFDAPEVDRTTYERVAKYAFFSSRNKNILEKILYRVMMCAQFWVDRGRRYGIQYQKGANWFSITDDCARYIVSQRQWVERVFSRTRCGDEFFIQTLIVNSRFKDRLYTPNFNNDYAAIRYCIDWERGNPYIFREEDFAMLKNSGMLFARKFDSTVDEKIIALIESSVTGRHEEA
ncbi:hypothetical protein EP30_02205 [Bifidobacterium sp. UTCIF-39]|uniref:beta-1,6-N-acetylglucosaminyltransferase n=1 Tax=Bifidobacterium sp. UTCIF-39 TaxID=1465359 RepID=UPI0011299A48|nr:beta-1,6-N-acetylglucosaminyltransferase [Bifidobacterium sp. UTCIF-39]TPF97428.1 hypothetical protein EP30_02205 [Bifidobacterium sp. UTCIF-39]